jgi:hypothetical protein
MTCRRRVAGGVVLVVILALSQHAAFGAKGDPQKRLTAADSRRATSVLLTRADLGAVGWKSGASAHESGCGIVLSLNPVESDLVETGVATGPLFSNKSYEALAQTVRVFATAHQENTAWARTVNKKLVICMEQQVENTSSMGAAVSVTDWSPLKFSKTVGHVAGFRVTATATSGRTKPKVYLDVIVLGHSRTMTRIIFSSLRKPFSTAYESRLARIVSQRLNSA